MIKQMKKKILNDSSRESTTLNNLLSDPSIMASFNDPVTHNKLDILSPEDNHGLQIMQAHNKFIEYLKNRARLS